MNTDLENALITILNKSIETAESASNFLVAEIPDVAAQALMYYGAINFLGAITAIGVFIYCFITIGNSSKKDPTYWERKTRDSEDLRYNLPLLLRFLGMVVSFIIAAYKIPTTLKIYLAPKLWLIEYATSIATKVS